MGRGPSCSISSGISRLLRTPASCAIRWRSDRIAGAAPGGRDPPGAGSSPRRATEAQLVSIRLDPSCWPTRRRLPRPRAGRRQTRRSSPRGGGRSRSRPWRGAWGGASPAWRAAPRGRGADPMPGIPARWTAVRLRPLTRDRAPPAEPGPPPPEGPPERPCAGRASATSRTRPALPDLLPPDRGTRPFCDICRDPRLARASPACPAPRA